MRIIGTNIPDNKRVEIGLMYFYGIGRALSNVILGKTHIDKNKRVKDLSVQEVNSIKDYIEKHYKDLKKFIKYYRLFKKISKCEYTPREEFRKHITLIVKDKKPLEITTVVLETYFEIAKEFVRMVEKKVQ